MRFAVVFLTCGLFVVGGVWSTGAPIHMSKDGDGGGGGGTSSRGAVNAFQKIGSGASYGVGAGHPNDILVAMPGTNGMMMRPTKIGRPYLFPSKFFSAIQLY